MELPRIDVIANSNPRGISVLIREHALSSIAPIVEYFLVDDTVGSPVSQVVLDMAKARAEVIVRGLIEENYIFKTRKEWLANSVELVANKLGRSVRYGKLIEVGYTGFYISDKKVLADCLVDWKGELYDRVKLYPAEIIQWLTEELDQPKLYDAVESFKNEMILEIANIK